MCKPFVKWAGGKRQLLPEIKRNMPSDYNKYFEPFVGGGALLFELKHNGAYINDFNSELVNLYEVVKECPEELIADLKEHVNTKEYYYDIRALDRDKDFDKLSKVKRASRFIFLNRTCFNGLYRVNRRGQFNVPYGKYKNPKIVDEKNILSCSKLLQDTTILNGNFDIIKEYIHEGDFVYLDPPYAPLSETSDFTAYTENGFDSDKQIQLKRFCDYIHNIGAYFMVSNSCVDFITDLYKDYTIIEVEAKRAINSNANNRGKVKEVLVVNSSPR